MISKLLNGGIDLPKLEQRTIALETAFGKCHLTKAPLNGWVEVVPLHQRLADIEEALASMATSAALSHNTAQCQIRMNGLQDMIASRALAEDVETLMQRLERAEWEANSLSATVGNLSATVAALTKQVEALTAAKLSEVKARKASKKDAAK